MCAFCLSFRSQETLSQCHFLNVRIFNVYDGKVTVCGVLFREGTKYVGIIWTREVMETSGSRAESFT